MASRADDAATRRLELEGDERFSPWEQLAAALTSGRKERDRERTCEDVCRTVVESFGFSRALIATLDRKRERLITRAGYDPSIGVHVARALRRLFTIPLAPRPDGKLLAAAWCVLEDEQVHVPDASSYSFRPDRTTQRSTLIRAFGTQEYVLTPIHGARGPIGVLAADRSRQESTVGPEDLRTLRLIASLVGLGLEAGGWMPRAGAPDEAIRPVPGRPMEHPGREALSAEAGTEGRARSERPDRTGQMQAVLDSLYQAVLILGPDGDVRYINRAGSALLDVLPWEAVGRHWRDVVPLIDPKAFDTLVDSAATQHTRRANRWRLRSPIGEPVVVQAEVLPLASVHAGRGTVLFLEDVSEEAEEERIRDQFVSMLVHDLSAPLQSVLGFAELLMLGRGGELSETQRDFVSRIDSSGRFMVQLVEDILEVTELESGRALLEPETLDVHALVKEAVDGLEGLAERCTVALSNEVPRVLPALRGDRIRLLQALQNVVTNAIEASGSGDTVRVRADTFRQEDDPWLRLQVADAGVGLTAEAAVHLFDKYRSYGRRKLRGRRSRGLGLPIARLVIEGHGGEIYAAGGDGKGTTITIELPLSGDEE